MALAFWRMVQSVPARFEERGRLPVMAARIALSNSGTKNENPMPSTIAKRRKRSLHATPVVGWRPDCVAATPRHGRSGLPAHWLGWALPGCRTDAFPARTLSPGTLSSVDSSVRSRLTDSLQLLPKARSLFVHGRPSGALAGSPMAAEILEIAASAWCSTSTL
jgi:hypothetical protein